ncbi:MAG: prolyl oligopeptidase family serine peptidase [Bacteroidales bacterium]|nr:prolyl oligopeptidase family serine peptidase [Bacteroidales bacterium]
MKKALLLIIGTFVLFSCQKYPEYAGNFNKKIKIDGLQREYILHLPFGYSQNKEQKIPLLIALHGGGGNPRNMMNESDFNKISNKENFIVVYPAAYDNFWADARDASKSSLNNIDDVNFIKALVDTLSIHYNIDKNMIYVTGISNGGFMTQTLLCALPDLFAGGASVIATLPENFRDSVPLNSVSSMLIVGTDDPLVPYEGGEMINPTSGGFIISAEETAKIWAKSNSCDTIPVKTDLPDIEDDETTITLYEYKNGQKPVQLYVVNGGGHAWPGGSQYLPKSVIGKRSKDINASEIIWEFFKNNPK